MAVKAGDQAAPRAMVLVDADEPYEPARLRPGQSRAAGRARPAAVPPRPGRRRSRAVRPRQRPARPRPGHHRRRQPADQPGHRQPRLDAPLRRAPGLDAQRLRHPQQPAVASRAARRPGRPVHAGGLVAQGAASADHALEHLSAGEPRPARLPQGRPREPPALAVQPPPARPRGHARHAAVRLGPARSRRWEAGRWTWSTTRKTTRRTVYGLVDRQSLPAVFRAFDFASPDLSAERRPRTTVPQQALFSMNAPAGDRAGQGPRRPARDRRRLDPGGPDRGALPPRPRPAARSGSSSRRPAGSWTAEPTRRGRPRTAPSSTACSSSPRCCS